MVAHALMMADHYRILGKEKVNEMKKSEAKWLNAREKAMEAIPSVCWEWADMANALIHWDDIERVYIVDNPEYDEEFRTVEELKSFCVSELSGIYYNCFKGIEKALLRA